MYWTRWRLEHTHGNECQWLMVVWFMQFIQEECTGLWSWMRSFSVYAQLLRTIMQLKGLNVLLLSFLNCISVSQCRLSPLESSIELQTNVKQTTQVKVSFSVVTLISDTLAVFDHMFSLKSYNMHLYIATSRWQKAIVSMDVFIRTITGCRNFLSWFSTACPWSC